MVRPSDLGGVDQVCDGAGEDRRYQPLDAPPEPLVNPVDRSSVCLVRLLERLQLDLPDVLADKREVRQLLREGPQLGEHVLLALFQGGEAAQDLAVCQPFRVRRQRRPQLKVPSMMPASTASPPELAQRLRESVWNWTESSTGSGPGPPLMRWYHRRICALRASTICWRSFAPLGPQYMSSSSPVLVETPWGVHSPLGLAAWSTSQTTPPMTGCPEFGSCSKFQASPASSEPQVPTGTVTSMAPLARRARAVAFGP